MGYFKYSTSISDRPAGSLNLSLRGHILLSNQKGQDSSFIVIDFIH